VEINGVFFWDTIQLTSESRAVPLGSKKKSGLSNGSIIIEPDPRAFEKLD
jgi:hypothetical protein